MSRIRQSLATAGFAVSVADELQLTDAARRHGPALAKEWEALEPDKYLRSGARFRERRYSRFSYRPASNAVRLLPHRPYFQSANANSYAGGIHRQVAPLTEASLANPLLHALLESDFAEFPVTDEKQLDLPWEVACHQFRIIGTTDEEGLPTPEGVHRDEIDFGAIHLMSRHNVTGGDSRIYDNDQVLMAEFCLRSFLDTLFWADRDVLHEATAIAPLDAGRPALRDILILGFRCEPDLDDSDGTQLPGHP